MAKRRFRNCEWVNGLEIIYVMMRPLSLSFPRLGGFPCDLLWIHSVRWAGDQRIQYVMNRVVELREEKVNG